MESCKKKISFLLGAGFSAPMGYPLADQVNDHFNHGFNGRLLHRYDGEWQFKYAEFVLKQYDTEIIEKFLTDALDKYRLQCDNFNYEKFYQFICDNYDKYISEYEIYKSTVLEVFNYLIASVLTPTKDSIKQYYNFLKLCNKYECDIFTLNHDCLLEKLFFETNLAFSDGFDTQKSILEYRGHPVPQYNGIFNRNIRVYKLHGSVNQYMFNDGEVKDIYFKSNKYVEKSELHKKGENSVNLDIAPKFITGTDKMKLISKNAMYRDLYQRFQKAIEATKYLIVIGYSFSDEHINNVLRKAQNVNTYINIDPYINNEKIKNILGIPLNKIKALKYILELNDDILENQNA